MLSHHSNFEFLLFHQVSPSAPPLVALKQKGIKVYIFTASTAIALSRHLTKYGFVHAMPNKPVVASSTAIDNTAATHPIVASIFPQVE